MSPQQRLDRIVSYADGPQTLANALQKYPREMWQFKPAPHKWSIHEIIVHLADAEAHAYVRCRSCLAEPGKTVMGFDQDAYAGALDYHLHDINEALELIRLLRLTTARLIRHLPDEAWARAMNHSERGSITLLDWLVGNDDHLHAHVRQMERNHEAWKHR